MRRRPPFALVLVAFVAALGAALALMSSGGGHRSSRGNIPSSGQAQACVTARAQARAVATMDLRIPVSVTQPVSVTERSGAGAATLSENAVERAVATRTLQVRQRAVARGRACARRPTNHAARGAALTRAYKNALTAAHAKAGRVAAKSLRALSARQRQSLVASARRALEARLRSAARAVRLELVARAKARVP